jgi:hypothetical protein
MHANYWQKLLLLQPYCLLITLSDTSSFYPLPWKQCATQRSDKCATAGAGGAGADSPDCLHNPIIEFHTTPMLLKLTNVSIPRIESHFGYGCAHSPGVP